MKKTKDKPGKELRPDRNGFRTIPYQHSEGMVHHPDETFGYRKIIGLRNVKHSYNGISNIFINRPSQLIGMIRLWWGRMQEAKECATT